VADGVVVLLFVDFKQTTMMLPAACTVYDTETGFADPEDTGVPTSTPPAHAGAHSKARMMSFRIAYLVTLTFTVAAPGVIDVPVPLQTFMWTALVVGHL